METTVSRKDLIPEVPLWHEALTPTGGLGGRQVKCKHAVRPDCAPKANRGAKQEKPGNAGRYIPQVNAKLGM